MKQSPGFRFAPSGLRAGSGEDRLAVAFEDFQPLLHVRGMAQLPFHLEMRACPSCDLSKMDMQLAAVCLFLVHRPNNSSGAPELSVRSQT